MNSVPVLVWMSAVALWQHMGHEMSSGPHATWEYVLAGFSVAVVLWVFYLAVRMTLRPGEDEKTHIKRTVLDDDWKLSPGKDESTAAPATNESNHE